MTKAEQNKVRDAWVIWVQSRCKWKYMLTLTFKNPTFEKSGRHFLNNWLQHLLHLDPNMLYFMSMESNEYDEVHFHGLMLTSIPFTVLFATWKHGFSKIVEIQSSDEVVRYIVKYITKNGSFWSENFEKLSLTSLPGQDVLFPLVGKR